jgi:hypothetical protein
MRQAIGQNNGLSHRPMNRAFSARHPLWADKPRATALGWYEPGLWPEGNCRNEISSMSAVKDPGNDKG